MVKKKKKKKEENNKILNKELNLVNLQTYWRLLNILEIIIYI